MSSHFTFDLKVVHRVSRRHSDEEEIPAAGWLERGGGGEAAETGLPGPGQEEEGLHRGGGGRQEAPPQGPRVRVQQNQQVSGLVVGASVL